MQYVISIVALLSTGMTKLLSRFGQARLKHKSVASLDRRVTYTGRYFANKVLRNMRGDRRQDYRYDRCLCRRLPRVFTYNALGNAVRKLQSHRHQRPNSPAAPYLCCSLCDDRQNLHIML